MSESTEIVERCQRPGPPWDVAEDGTPPPPGKNGEASPDEILESLRAVYDPEIGINIVDLGLVYDVERRPEGDVKIVMTLTSPACPLGPVIMDQVQYIAGRMPGVENTSVEFVWVPTWDPRQMASEEAKAELGIW